MTDTATLGQTPIEKCEPEPDDLRHWSVTTIIGALDKPALVYWSAEETAKAAIADVDAWRAIEASSGTDEAVKWLTGARFRRPKGQRTAAELGTAVHEACETYALTGTRPEVDDEVRPFLEQFDGWCQTFSPTYQAAEVTVYSDLGFAGTCDAFLTVDGVRFIADNKTTRKSFDKRGNPTSPYPEQVGLQLAAYRHADCAAVWRPRRMEKFRRRYYLLSEAERAMAVPVPEVDMGLVIHITPEHCEAWPIECGPDIFKAFLYVQEAARWSFQTSKTVMGQPLTPPVERGAA